MLRWAKTCFLIQVQQGSVLSVKSKKYNKLYYSDSLGSCSFALKFKFIHICRIQEAGSGSSNSVYAKVRIFLEKGGCSEKKPTVFH